ncbi:ArsR/SmtB family transcription factor [Neorhizobium alkalisoli]|uniref:DNA-binding transcriptional ArsR family regulator n=1 Tax=Neorhizobium alkalisoli TaxID=528178 RepID=A0A561QXC5_9HYPH|nr:winged helix-turn-helix domain-containing protein [Neorhizobium alkalisoli]TWF55027.1 DNA-binding transcriptional ArsR family regulator [Neorhizobium alkalisoli]
MKLAFKQATAFLAYVSNDVRLQIMCEILHSAKTAGDIAGTIGLPCATVSQHLKRLRDAELVYFQTAERETYYMLAPGIAGNLLGFLEAHFPSITTLHAGHEAA